MFKTKCSFKMSAGPIRLGMMALQGAALWETFGVFLPNIQRDKDGGADIASCEENIVLALLELGRDQARKTRTNPDGFLDMNDALKGEREEVEFNRVLAVEANEEKKGDEEENVRVNTGNKSKKTKRTRQQVPIEQQLIQQEADRVRTKQL